MSIDTAWLTVLIAGAGCYVLRISLVVLIDHRQPSANAIRLAGHVMPAAFAALAASALWHTGETDAADAVVPAIGAVVTAVVAVRTKSSNAALIAGLVAVALATALGAA